MDILQIAAKLFMQKAGSGDMDVGQVISALKGLLPMQGSEVDLAGLVSMFTSQGGGLASLASSWLGDGANSDVSASAIMDIFGEGKVNDFATSLGLSKDGAAEGLSSIIPELIDKSSSGGAIQEAAASEIGKKLLGGFF